MATTSWEEGDLCVCLSLDRVRVAASHSCGTPSARAISAILSQSSRVNEWLAVTCGMDSNSRSLTREQSQQSQQEMVGMLPCPHQSDSGRNDKHRSEQWLAVRSIWRCSLNAPCPIRWAGGRRATPRIASLSPNSTLPQSPTVADGYVSPVRSGGLKVHGRHHLLPQPVLGPPPLQLRAPQQHERPGHQAGRAQGLTFIRRR